MLTDEFIHVIAKKTGMYVYQAENFLNAFEETVAEVLASGDYVNLYKFGGFDTVVRKGCMVIPPATKEPVYVPDKLKIKFTPYKGLKEKVCDKQIEYILNYQTIKRRHYE